MSPAITRRARSESGSRICWRSRDGTIAGGERPMLGFETLTLRADRPQPRRAETDGRGGNRLARRLPRAGAQDLVAAGRIPRPADGSRRLRSAWPRRGAPANRQGLYVFGAAARSARKCATSPAVDGSSRRRIRGWSRPRSARGWRRAPCPVRRPTGRSCSRSRSFLGRTSRAVQREQSTERYALVIHGKTCSWGDCRRTCDVVPARCGAPRLDFARASSARTSASLLPRIRASVCAKQLATSLS